MAYKHILAVYDGSQESEEVLDMVCRVAKPHRGRITILVLRLLPLSRKLPAYKPGADPETDALMSRAEHLAERVGVKAATTVRYGRALGAAVVAEARLHGCDMLALSLPDLDKLPSEHAWHTDARTILRQTSCGVMLCRPGRAR